MESNLKTNSTKLIRSSILKTLVPHINHPIVKNGSERLIELIAFCQANELPFPVEANAGFTSWWHCLHEIAHWAILPKWYRRLGAYVMQIQIKQITPNESDVLVKSKRISSKPIYYYHAGNDVIPSLGMAENPMPYEAEVRTWCLNALDIFDYNHPSSEPDFSHPQSFKVWDPTLKNDKKAIRSMARFGIDFKKPQLVAIDDSVQLENPKSLSQLIALQRIVYHKYSNSKKPYYVSEYWLKCMSSSLPFLKN